MKREPKQKWKDLFHRLVPTKIYKYFYDRDKNFKFSSNTARKLASCINLFMKQSGIRFPAEMRTYQNKDLRLSFGETYGNISRHYKQIETVKDLFRHSHTRVSESYMPDKTFTVDHLEVLYQRAQNIKTKWL